MKRFLSILLLLALLAGAGWLGYGAVTGQMAKKRLNDAAESYLKWSDALPEQARREKLKAARAWNEGLTALFADGAEDAAEPPDISGENALAVVEIPGAGVRLSVAPNEGAADMGAWLVGGTSLPVGGTSVSTVIAAPSGPKGFDGLGSMGKGDLIYLRTLGETLIYQVDSTQALPDYTAARLVPGGDYVTLAAPEKDGWRLVRGRRVSADEAAQAMLATDAKGVSGIGGALICAIPFFAAFMLIAVLLMPLRVWLAARRRRRRAEAELEA